MIKKKAVKLQKVRVVSFAYMVTLCVTRAYIAKIKN